MKVSVMLLPSMLAILVALLFALASSGPELALASQPVQPEGVCEVIADLANSGYITAEDLPHLVTP